MTDAVLGIDVSIDAAVLAKLHASEFLPEVWMRGEETSGRQPARCSPQT
jgi:hypothetical protein